MAEPNTVAATSRIRLARNLNGYPFPSRLKDDKQAKEIIRAASSAIIRDASFPKGAEEFKLYYMDGIKEDDALNLVENHLISPLLLKRPRFSAAVINERRNISIMINEEDHLREQCIEKGLSLRKAYAVMSEMDSALARSIQFAYDEQLGYLTACPTNLGTGLRASVMLFLPALTMSGLMPKVIRSATRLGLTVRGMYGEGSQAEGYMYQLSNEVTLGVTEEDILTQVEQVVERVAEMEMSERRRLKTGERAVQIKDMCLRAYGVLTHCALLASDEFEKLCASLKLGVCLGYISSEGIGWLDDLIVAMKPSNINTLAGRKMNPQERDLYRAEYVSRHVSEGAK